MGKNKAPLLKYLRRVPRIDDTTTSQQSPPCGSGYETDDPHADCPSLFVNPIRTTGVPKRCILIHHFLYHHCLRNNRDTLNGLWHMEAARIAHQISHNLISGARHPPPHRDLMSKRMHLSILIHSPPHMDLRSKRIQPIGLRHPNPQRGHRNGT
jgi:hypothetical protein